ncbi:hypothetical protein SPISAL_00525 [Spiribacter salinus M19-40]|uniref:Porin domain-containing protein n=1 Tax=Spiribacter salinus M19-40 TaxID=1260251 RepID=R4VCZ9_9GAMM|nr:hypothetical protein [Spiribacter salinus]AGM40206.1 hypothetical protein SPISAL_00525 [Spiribacter salinus M19-40]MBY5268563.1 hypothetical protein [Spiribacter salinus]
MKKMNIALFTAAAMIGSTAAIADEHVDGPNLSGRIQTIFEDADENTDDSLNMNNWHIAASGSATDLLGGIDASYYSRLSNYGGNGGAAGDPYVEYGFVTFSFPGADITAGRTDDLHYQFADSQVFALQPRNFDGIGGADFNTVDSLTVTSDLGGSPVTVGGYVNTRNGAGVEDTQFAISADIGVGTLAAVYSDSDTDTVRTERLTVAGTVDLDVATLTARVEDRDDDQASNGDMPYTIAAGIPVADSTTLYVMHGSDDGANGDDDSSTGVEARTLLGAGLDVFVGMTNGENSDGTSADNVYVGSRWQF